MALINRNARPIAFYLPQFHPTPENDAWWGRGFTEWTNVAKARPLFRGHDQPHVPADLGFYDLRLPETRLAQAELAREHGIASFCYWHYWFAGRRMLERPFNEVLKSGQPDFPFCLAWANQTWSGVWHGEPDRILIEQTYPGLEDYRAHFYAVLEAFGDERYITVDGKPLFVVYYPYGLPQPRQFTDCWRELAVEVGLKGLYLAAIAMPGWMPEEHGFDASIVNNPAVAFNHLSCFQVHIDKACRKLSGKTLKQAYHQALSRLFPRPTVYLYRDVIRYMLPELARDFEQYPCVMPNWDNTPRSGANGYVFHNSTPELFRVHLHQAIEQVARKPPDRRLVFIKSWNEWAEGNYLEPDVRFGRSYLEVIQEEVRYTDSQKAALES